MALKGFWRKFDHEEGAARVQNLGKGVPLNPEISDRNRHRWMETDSYRSQRQQCKIGKEIPVLLTHRQKGILKF